MVDTEGPADGSDEIEGGLDGIEEGASLCGTASAIRKSATRREVNFTTNGHRLSGMK